MESSVSEMYGRFSPPAPKVACGHSIIKRLMMLNPWANNIKFQGQTERPWRTSNSTTAIMTNTAKRTGSHHSWEVGEKEAGGNRTSGIY